MPKNECYIRLAPSLIHAVNSSDETKNNVNQNETDTFALCPFRLDIYLSGEIITVLIWSETIEFVSNCFLFLFCLNFGGGLLLSKADNYHVFSFYIYLFFHSILIDWIRPSVGKLVGASIRLFIVCYNDLFIFCCIPDFRKPFIEQISICHSLVETEMNFNSSKISK